MYKGRAHQAAEVHGGGARPYLLIAPLYNRGGLIEQQSQQVREAHDRARDLVKAAGASA